VAYTVRKPLLNLIPAQLIGAWHSFLVRQQRGRFAAVVILILVIIDLSKKPPQKAETRNDNARRWLGRPATGLLLTPDAIHAIRPR
jgi:hypothetical protein